MFREMVDRKDTDTSAKAKPRNISEERKRQTFNMAAVMGNSNFLAQELRDNGCQFRSQTSIKCPFHEDTTPSAEIRLQNGVYRFVCHAANCKVCEDFFGVRARFQNKTSDQVIAEYRDAFDRAA